MIETEFTKWKNNNKINVYKGKKKEAEVILDNYNITTYPLKNNEELEIKISADNEFEAPLNVNTSIGKLKISIKGNIIYEINIKIKETIERKSIKDYFIYMVKEYNSYLETFYKIF